MNLPIHVVVSHNQPLEYFLARVIEEGGALQIDLTYFRTGEFMRADLPCWK